MLRGSLVFGICSLVEPKSVLESVVATDRPRVLTGGSGCSWKITACDTWSCKAELIWIIWLAISACETHRRSSAAYAGATRPRAEATAFGWFRRSGWVGFPLSCWIPRSIEAQPAWIR
jgi:hypothetical protein